MIDERKEEVMAELKVIEDKMQWNFRNKNATENDTDKESDAENHDDEDQKENILSEHEDVEIKDISSETTDCVKSMTDRHDNQDNAMVTVLQDDLKKEGNQNDNDAAENSCGEM